MLSKLDSKMLRSQILRLFPSLFRDCQGEIFELFLHEILQKLSAFLDIKQTDIIQEIFMVFAYALKYLFTRIVHEFTAFFNVFFYELFGNSNKFIRNFAAESFSFILKKLNKNELKRKIEILLEIAQKLDYQEFERNFECLAELLYESMKINSNSENLSYKFAEIYDTFWGLIVEKYSQNTNILQLFYTFVKILITKTGVITNKMEKNVIKTYDLTDFYASLSMNFKGNLSEKLKEIIVKTFLFAISSQKTIKITSKILDYQLEVLLAISNGENQGDLHKIVMIFLGKICKNAFMTLSRSSIEKLERILFENTENNKKNGFFFIIGLICSDVFGEKPEEKPEESQFSEFLSRKYTIPKKVYEYCVILLLKDFSFEELFKGICDKTSLLRFYLFFMVHKYNNSEKIIEICDKKTEVFPSETIEKIEKLFDFTDENRVFRDFLNILIVMKMMKIVDFNEKIKENIVKIFEKSADSIDKILEKNDEKIGELLEKNEFYDLSEEFLDFYRFSEISLELSSISRRKALILLKTGIFQTFFNRKTMGIYSDFQQKMITIFAKIRKELFLLKKLRKNLGNLKNLFEILSCFFEEITIKKINCSIFEGITDENDKIGLKYGDFKESFQALCDNLTSNYREIRLFSLKILEFFEVFPMENSKEKRENREENSIFIGNCEIIPLLLHVIIEKIK